MKIAIRGYAGKAKVFEERIEAAGPDLDSLVRKYLVHLLPYERHTIEVEFLEEPDINQRFFRFGTDPHGMVQPIAIELREADGKAHE